jgi:predicted RNA binding protein YcfA (HicA-like mRNA interferase family)
MTPRLLPSLNAKQVIRALQDADFVIARISGSHHYLIHRFRPDRRVTVPFHGGRDLPRGTIRAILDQAGLSVDEFIELL